MFPTEHYQGSSYSPYPKATKSWGTAVFFDKRLGTPNQSVCHCGIIIDTFIRRGRMTQALVDRGPLEERIPDELLDRRERDIFQVVIVS